MYEIPKPELLDPDRVDRDDREALAAEDHRSQAQLLAKALGESCAYAEQLWDQLNDLRGYLLDSLPPDPRTSGPHTTTATSPTGPDDEHGWEQWIKAFATTTSVLCGSHGDSGFGLSRARQEAQLRRTAAGAHPARPGLDRPPPAPHDARPSPNSPVAGCTTANDDATSPPRSDTPRSDTVAAIAKAAGATVIGVLALRGLRSTQRTPPRERTDS